MRVSIKQYWMALLLSLGGLSLFLMQTDVLAVAKTQKSIPASVQHLYGTKLPDVQGKTQAIEKWRGKVMVVNFWATWCSPCIAEMPELDALYKKYRAKEVVVVGISTDDLDQLSEFEASKKVKYPLLAGGMGAMNMSLLLGNNKGVVPYTVIIDKDGQLVSSYFGRVDISVLEEDLMAAIKP